MERLHPDLESNTGSKGNVTRSTRRKSFAFFGNSVCGHTSARFVAGTALIAGSFLVYLAYPIILLIMPFSRSIKVGATIAVWFASWGAFSFGIFLAGPEGVERFKSFWLRIIGSQGWAKPDQRKLSDE